MQVLITTFTMASVTVLGESWTDCVGQPGGVSEEQAGGGGGGAGALVCEECS